MSVAASLSTLANLDDAVHQVCQHVQSALEGTDIDLAVLFVSHAHAERFDTLPQMVSERLNARVLIGCGAETVVGGDTEIEDGPAFSLWAGAFPGAEFQSFHVEFEQTPDGLLCTGLPAETGAGEPARAIIALADPFSSVPGSLFAQLNEYQPGVPLVGGMASGGRGPLQNAMFLNDRCIRSGGVGVLVRGGPRIRTIVSQGCRPIGRPLVITSAERNFIQTLGGMPAVERFEEMITNVPERDQRLATQGLHLGVAVNEYQESFERGDFLVSNVLGADPETGAIAIANEVRVGQTVQFHVRDADSAHEDLTEMLERDQKRNSTANGALLFSCNGRGTRLFGSPNHDASTIQDISGPIPLAGFFAQGEFGPVGMKNCIHGFTASIAVFE